jgi:hypothetical protein
MTGIDMQGYGYPPNPAFFEYVQVTGINSMTGQITIAAPLNNTYKSTWPLYFAGSSLGIDAGGPATLYALDPTWDTKVEYRGLTISQAGQTDARGRDITFRDVTFTGANCGFPSQNLSWQVINSNMSTCTMEADKIVGTMTLSGVTIRRINFQSSSIDLFSMDSSTVTDFINGTPKKSAISNSTITSLTQVLTLMDGQRRLFARIVSSAVLANMGLSTAALLVNPSMFYIR